MRGGAAGVALKRGAGAGCNTPSAVKKVPRARLCGCAGASAIERTGAKHASVISSIAHHSARVRDLNIAVNLARCAGQERGSFWAAKSGSSASHVRTRNSAKNCGSSAPIAMKA